MLVWLIAWVDMFIIGRFFDEYHLGLYRTANTMVIAIVNIITTILVSTLFPALSRLQKEENAFNEVFLKTLKLATILVIPLGAGIFFFQGLATQIMLGSKWSDAAFIIGVKGLSSIFIVFSRFNTTALIAKGKILAEMVVQFIFFAILVPTCVYFAGQGFSQMVYAINLISVLYAAFGLFFMWRSIRFPVRKIFTSTFPSLISALVMGGAAYLLLLVSQKIWWQFVAILICVFVYFGFLLLFPSTRKILLDMCEKVYNIMRTKVLKKEVPAMATQAEVLIEQEERGVQEEIITEQTEQPTSEVCNNTEKQLENKSDTTEN
jgi:PST family polysaccharide transporter